MSSVVGSIGMGLNGMGWYDLEWYWIVGYGNGIELEWNEAYL